MGKEIIARLSSHGTTFEFYVDSEKVQAFKEGTATLEETVIGSSIFTDLALAKRATEDQLMEAFKTIEFEAVARKILENGEIQLTVEQRRQMTEQKRAKIVSYIAKRAVDPKTKLPHPPQRIELAMEQAKVRIDPFVSAEGQIKDILQQLSKLLPLSFETRTIEAKIPVKFVGLAKRVLEKGTIKNESWYGNDWNVVAEVPAGMVSQIFDELNGVTHGQVIANVQEKK